MAPPVQEGRKAEERQSLGIVTRVVEVVGKASWERGGWGTQYYIGMTAQKEARGVEGSREGLTG